MRCACAAPTCCWPPRPEPVAPACRSSRPPRLSWTRSRQSRASTQWWKRWRVNVAATPMHRRIWPRSPEPTEPTQAFTMTAFHPGQLVMVDIPGKVLDDATAAFLRANQVRAVCLFRKNLGTEAEVHQLTHDLRDVMGPMALIGHGSHKGARWCAPPFCQS